MIIMIIMSYEAMTRSDSPGLGRFVGPGVYCVSARAARAWQCVTRHSAATSRLSRQCGTGRVTLPVTVAPAATVTEFSLR